MLSFYTYQYGPLDVDKKHRKNYSLDIEASPSRDSGIIMSPPTPKEKWQRVSRYGTHPLNTVGIFSDNDR